MSRRGWSKTPCHGCGGEQGHPSGRVCYECQELMRDGRDARAREEKDRQAAGVDVYRWPDRAHGWPRFYGCDADIPSDAHRALGNAFWNLVNVVSSPAPSTTPVKSPKSWHGRMIEDHEPWPTLLSDPGHSYDSWGFLKLVTIQPAVRDALDALHVEIKATLGATFEDGKAKGSSVLQGLARGAISLDDFDDALLSRSEREERRRRR